MQARASAVTKPEGKALTTIDFAQDAGLGIENADKASFAVPFIVVLQSNSPQLETLSGAKAGLFLNSVTDKLYESVSLIPVAFQRRYLEWQPRSAGGGFRGEHSVVDVEADNKLGWTRSPEGQLVLPNGNLLKDTRHHFVLLLDEEDGPMQALFSMSSTQIKKSKRWMSRIQGIQMKDANGAMYNPPSFSHIYRATTVSEENDKGKWKGVQIDLVGPVTDPALYQAAKHFHSLIVQGQVEVAPPPMGSDEPAQDRF